MITSHELLGFMPSAMAIEILEYVYANDKPLYHAVTKAVAEACKVRPVFLERQPRTSRHQTMLATLCRPALDLIAGNLIRTWLLKKQTALLVSFLNTLGIAHQDGIAEDLPKEIDEAKLRSAVEELLAHHPKETVTIYLHAFNAMNETRWACLDELLKTDPRLQL
jgi:hypothetical protein